MKGYLFLQNELSLSKLVSIKLEKGREVKEGWM